MAAQVEHAGIFVHRFAHAPALRRMVGLEGHVKLPNRDQDPEDRFQAMGRVGVDNAHQQTPDHCVHQALGILAVVDGAHARNPAQEKGKSGGYVRTDNAWRIGNVWSAGRRGRSGRFGRLHRHVFRAVYRAERVAPAFLADRLAAIAAVSSGRSFGMILAIHISTP